MNPDTHNFVPFKVNLLHILVRVEDGEVLESRQLDMGNSGLHVGERYLLIEVAQVA